MLKFLSLLDIMVIRDVVVDFFSYLFRIYRVRITTLNGVNV